MTSLQTFYRIKEADQKISKIRGQQTMKDYSILNCKCCYRQQHIRGIYCTKSDCELLKPWKRVLNKEFSIFPQKKFETFSGSI
jgi:hypothetical protein